MDNREFSKKNEVFTQACKLSKVKATTRQASKFRNKKGTVYNYWLPRRHNWEQTVNHSNTK